MNAACGARASMFGYGNPEMSLSFLFSCAGNIPKATFQLLPSPAIYYTIKPSLGDIKNIPTRFIFFFCKHPCRIYLSPFSIFPHTLSSLIGTIFSPTSKDVFISHSSSNCNINLPFFIIYVSAVIVLHTSPSRLLPCLPRQE